MKIKNQSFRLGAITMLAGFSLASQQAHSAAIVYESFSQTAGDLNGQAASTTGLSGNWSDVSTVTVVTTPTLTYGDLPNSGGEIVLVSSGGTDAFVTTSSALGDAGLLADGASLWFSFMYEKDGSGGATNEKGGFAFGTDRIDGAFNGTNMTNSGNGLGVQLLGTQMGAASWAGGGNFNSLGSTQGITLSQSYFIVGRIDWGATAGDVETITLFTPSTTGLALSASFSTTSMAGVDQTAFDTISMTARGATNNVYYDEIRFGASYDDVRVIPEPSITALIGLGGLALILRRRK